MKIPNIHLLVLAFFSTITLLGCNGGTSETGNARTATISGSLTVCGRPAIGAEVSLVAHDYIPESDSRANIYRAITNQYGHYTLDSVSWGSYYIHAVSGTKQLLAGPYDFIDQDKILDPDSLQSTSRILIPVSDTNRIDYAFIKGTVQPVKVINGYVTFDAVPVGDITIVGLKRESPYSNSPEKTFRVVNEINISSKPFDTLDAHFTNTAPHITSTSAELTRSISKKELYVDSVVVYDEEFNQLRFSLITSPSGMEIDTTTGKLTWLLHDTTRLTTYRIGVKVTDTDNASDSIEWNLTVIDTQQTLFSLYGTTHGTIRDTLYYYADTTIFTGDTICKFFWGDGSSSDWLAFPYAGHQWRTEGIYEVSLKVCSRFDSTVVQWSETLFVTISAPPDSEKTEMMGPLLY